MPPRNVFESGEENFAAHEDLMHRVRVILDDLFGMPQSEAQELIDELRDAGIGFVELN